VRVGDILRSFWECMGRGIRKEEVEGVVRSIEIKDMPEVDEEISRGIEEMVRNKDMRIEN
jgi:hypothetical protein